VRWGQSIVIFIVLIFIMLQSGAVLGTTCFGGPSPSEAYAAASMVFIGTIVAGDPPLPEAERTGQKIQVRVEKSFKGAEPGTLVRLEQTSLIDTPKFNVGERWLLYVHSSGQGVGTIPMCSRSTRDLDKLTIDDSGNRAVLSGSLEVRIGHTSKLKDSYSGTFLKKWQISVIGPGRKFNLLTDELGYYELFNPTPGMYEIKPELPDGLKIDSASLNAEISKDRDAITIVVGSGTCTSADFTFVWSTKLAGRVIEANGAPLSGSPVYVVPTESKEDYSTLYSFTDENGQYRIEGMPPGEYFLFVKPESIPPEWKPTQAFYFPSGIDRTKAPTITIRAGKDLQGYDLTIPNR
jgi:hypothetical protein